MQRFHYDSENRLISAQTWQGTTLSSEARYHYDALGRRIGKQVTQDGQTQVTKFLWQGLRLLQEQQPQLHSLYLYEPGSYAPLARIDSDPELPEQEARHYYFHTDQIGTPQEMTNVEGHVVWRAYYKAWGGLEALSPNLVEQNLRFQGQYHDRESGLYYNTFRYYDPAVGRFTTQDPIGLMGGDNLYRYAPNALGWIDPWGLACTPNVSRGMQGQPLSARATVGKLDLRKGTGTNAISRAWARMMGNSTDDAGHILGKVLGGQGGKGNVFPQLPGINRGQYRTFEDSVRKYINKSGAVDIEWTFKYGNGGTRPTEILYDVFQGGQKVLGGIFGN